MRADVAENSGLSAAGGAAVTALGGALLAVGLAQTDKTNCWVVAALVLLSVGTGWVLWTLAVALQASRKTRALRERLGEALGQGEGLRRSNLGGTPHPVSVADWAERTRKLIRAGLGEASVAYFDARAGGAQPDPDIQPQEEPLAYMLTRLKELMDQPTRANLDFPTRQAGSKASRRSTYERRARPLPPAFPAPD
jgi:hypothetical protein